MRHSSLLCCTSIDLLFQVLVALKLTLICYDMADWLKLRMRQEEREKREKGWQNKRSWSE